MYSFLELKQSCFNMFSEMRHHLLVPACWVQFKFAPFPLKFLAWFVIAEKSRTGTGFFSNKKTEH